MADDRMVIWTLYDSPSDYPGKFVARKWLVDREPVATDVVLVGDTLQEVRDGLPPGLFCLTRVPGDDPGIVECWL